MRELTMTTIDPAPVDHPDADLPAQRHMRPIVWILVAVGAALLIAVGVGAYFLRGDSDPLAKTDPIGAQSCKALRDWINGDVKDPKTGQPYDQILMAVSLGSHAKNAKTPAIRAAAGQNVMDGDAGELLQSYGGPADFRAANLPQMHDACVGAGVKMPAYATPGK